MFNGTLRTFVIAIILIQINFTVKANDYILKDAENFSLIFDKNKGVTPLDIKSKYLDILSKLLLKIINPRRIKFKKTTIYLAIYPML